jgi:UDP-glucuronate 4-epimerase
MILVTGCAGFIGHSVVLSLIARGNEVVGLDNLNAYYDPRLKQSRLAQCAGPGFTFCRGDLTDREALTEVFRRYRPQRIVHLAAQAGVRYSFENPQAYIDSNVTGFVNVLECARMAGDVAHIVYASSSSVYGANTKQPFAVGDAVEQPISLYAATKRADELIAYVYAMQYGLRLTGLRYFTVYGPWGRPDMAPLKFARAILEDRCIEVYGQGEMERDFTFIDDIARGTLCALDELGKFGPVPHRIYNLGNNQAEPLLRFISVLEQAIGKSARRTFAPMQAGDVRSTVADIESTTRDLGWHPITGIEVGLPRLVDWARRYYADVIMLTVVAMTSLYPSAHAAPADPPADPELTTLPSLVVTATRSPVQNLIDRKVYDVSVDLQSTTGTAADVLNQVPSVEVDADGNVSLRGNTKVIILVDGKPSAELSGAFAGDGLLQYPASDIERIEVMNNPPPQYKAEGSAGVINIITKKKRKVGRSGVVRANVGNNDRYGFGASGNYNTARLKLSGGLGLRQDTRKRIVDSTLVAVDPNTNNLAVSREHLYETLRRQIPSVKGSIDYQFNPHQSVEFSFSQRERSGSRFFDQHDSTTVQDGTPVAASDRHSDGHERRVNGDQTLRFTQILRQPEETLELSLHHTTAREHERYAYQNTHELPPGSATFDDLNLNMDLATTEFSADYAMKLSSRRSLKLGYDFEQDKSNLDNSGDTIDPVTGLPVVNPAVTNDFRFSQKVHAAYATFQADTESWGLQAGARVERTTVETAQITNGITSSRSYTRVYPTLHLERILSEDSTLSLSASRRVSRPDAQSLNPFIDTQATHFLRSGNPNLLPEDTQSLELAYSGVTAAQHYDMTAYLHRNRDSITDVTQLVNADTLLTTKANLAKSTSGGLEFTANGPILPKLSYGLSGNLYYTQIDATALGASGLKSTTGLNAKASLEFRPTKADKAQISFSRSDKRLTPQGYVGAINLVNLGYKRRIGKDLSVVLTATDLLNGQRYRRFISTPMLTSIYERTQVGRVFFVGVVYMIGPSKKNKETEIEDDE